MDSELHLTKKDFKIEWFSGKGAGGQRRNKVQTCCRITHLESGMVETGQNHAHRVANQKEAFTKLANRLIALHLANESERYKATETIRTYHAVRNEVHDKASGLKLPYKDTVEKNDISKFIEARRKEFQ
jgi:protein subunit release factor B